MFETLRLCLPQVPALHGSGKLIRDLFWNLLAKDHTEKLFIALDKVNYLILDFFHPRTETGRLGRVRAVSVLGYVELEVWEFHTDVGEDL